MKTLRYIIKFLNHWARLPLIGLAVLFGALVIEPPLAAFSSSYYGSSGYGRPPSAFSICCCKKLNENNVQVHYSCNLNEEKECPEGTKQYPGQGLDCASDLIFTKYTNTEE